MESSTAAPSPTQEQHEKQQQEHLQPREVTDCSSVASYSTASTASTFAVTTKCPRKTQRSNKSTNLLLLAATAEAEVEVQAEDAQHQSKRRELAAPPALSLPALANAAAVARPASSTATVEKVPPKQLFVLIRILFQYLEKVDRETLQSAKAILKDCDIKHKTKDSQYATLADAIADRVRNAVGEKHWSKAKAIQAELMKDKETRQTMELGLGPPNNNQQQRRARKQLQKKQQEAAAKKAMESEDPDGELKQKPSDPVIVPEEEEKPREQQSDQEKRREQLRQLYQKKQNAQMDQDSQGNETAGRISSQEEQQEEYHRGRSRNRSRSRSRSRYSYSKSPYRRIIVVHFDGVNPNNKVRFPSLERSRSENENWVPS